MGFYFLLRGFFRRSRRQLAAALNKECQFGFPEAVEEPADLDAAISYYQLDGAGDGVFPPLPVSMCWEKSSDDGGACVHGALRQVGGAVYFTWFMVNTFK